MKRREFITLLGGAAATWPLAARAQQPAMPLVALVSTAPREDYARFLSAFAEGLTELGFAEGRNVTFDYRWVSSEPDLPALAAEIVGRGPSVILTMGGTAAALALKNATPRMPVVFIVGSDPVEFGLVGSLNRPGSNITGLTSLSNSLAAKQLEMLHELAPNATTIGLMINPNNPNSEHDAREALRAAETIGHKLIIVTANSEATLNSAIASLVDHRAAAMLVASDLFFLRRRMQIVTLSARYVLPTMYDRRDYVSVGGLISYGNNRLETFRQAGVYVGRILKGEKAGDLPVQQATKFDLAVNLQTATALGLEMPAKLLALADEVIE
jgi:putative ABC transport system substrate-binding protein